MIIALSLKANDFPVKLNCKNNVCNCIKDQSFNVDSIILKLQNYEIQDTASVACVYHLLGVEYYNHFDDYQKAIKYYKRAIYLRTQFNDGWLWKSKLNLAVCLNYIGNYSESIKYLKDSKNLHGNPKRSKDSLLIFKLLADGNMQIGDFDQAVEFAKKSISVNAGEDRIRTALIIYSEILIEKDDPENIIDAISCLDTLRKSYYFNMDTSSLLRVNNLLGIAYDKAKNYDESIKYYNEALELEKYNPSKSELLNNIALVFLEKNDFINTKKYLRKSLYLNKQYFQSGYSNQYAPNYENFGDYFLKLNQFDSALSHYQKALINLTNNNFIEEDILQNPNPADDELFIYSNPDIIRVLHLKATAAHQYYQQNKNQEYLILANQTYQTAFDFHDKLQKEISTENSRLFQAKNIVTYIENALKIAYVLQESGRDVGESAFRFMEKNKATVLLQSMNEADALQFANLPNSLLAQEKDLKIAITYHNIQLNEAISELSPSGGGSKGGGIETKRLEKLLFEEKQQYSQLITNLENNYPNYYSLKYQQNQTHLKEVQQSLDDQTALLEYFVGDSSIYILSIKKDHSNLYQIKKPTNWKQIIHDFRTSITDSNKDLPELFVENADKLYQLLLNEPLCDMSEDITNLQIIPDAELNYIPFEILLTESADIKNIQYKKLPYLFKQKSIGYAYSAALLLENKNNTSTKKTWAYGGYAPIYYSNDTIIDLPIARDTVISLAKSLNGQSFIKEQANLSNFISDTNSYKILHLAMHGVLNDENPLSSYLAFTNAGSFKLHAYDLYNQKLNTELTILHACNTGSGELQKGEGVMSLSRAFTYAGCPSLVMSLWSIPEEATSKVTSSFIHHLKNGLAKDVALQKAKINYLNNAHETEASPAYWAGLVATGNLNSINLD